MKVFIAADMEGLAGLVTWDGADRATERELITAEINAAARGAFAGGATAFAALDHVAAQAFEGGEVIGPSDIAGMVLGQADRPLF